MRTLTVKMRVKSFLTGGSPRERLNDVELEDHLDCQCQDPGVQGETETDRGESDCNHNEIILSCCAALSIIAASLAVLVRHYRNKIKEYQLVDQRKQFCQQD